MKMSAVLRSQASRQLPVASLGFAMAIGERFAQTLVEVQDSLFSTMTGGVSSVVF
jgi:hypothetical protein